MSLNVCEVLRLWRWATRKELKDAAEEIGVSPSTLSRFERGEAAGGETIVKVVRWLLAETGPGEQPLPIALPAREETR